MLTNTRKVIKGVSSQTIVTIVLGIVEIVSFSIMSRLLSQKDFGYYVAIVAVATIFQSLADNGVKRNEIRDITLWAESENDNYDVLKVLKHV